MRLTRLAWESGECGERGGEGETGKTEDKYVCVIDV